MWIFIKLKEVRSTLAFFVWVLSEESGFLFLKMFPNVL